MLLILTGRSLGYLNSFVRPKKGLSQISEDLVLWWE